MRQEWHVTVTGDPMQWHRFLSGIKGIVKPLWIELNNFERQLMCASTVMNPSEIIMRRGFRIVRVKHEVEAPILDISTHSPSSLTPPVEGALYYETHVKFNGRFLPHLPMASRDLYRADRWYLTHRSEQPFDHMDFVRWAQQIVVGSNTFAGAEHEACLHDSNQELDARWV